jgi:hypothetical protein
MYLFYISVGKRVGRTKHTYINCVKNIYLYIPYRNQAEAPHSPPKQDCDEFVNSLNPSAYYNTCFDIHKLYIFLRRKMSLGLIRHHAIKIYREVEVLLHSFLTSTLDVGGWPTSQPGRLTPGESGRVTIR